MKQSLLNSSCNVSFLCHNAHTTLSQERQYTAYVMSVQCGGDTWTLKKRYSEFEAFYQQIRGLPSAEGIGFPSKAALTGLGMMWGGAAAQAAMQQQLVQRLTGLNDFVAQLVARSDHMPPNCRQLLYDFLGVVATTGTLKFGNTHTCVKYSGGLVVLM